MPAPPVVVAPLAEEVAPFVKRMAGRRVVATADLTLFEGEIAGTGVLAAIVGDGAPRAARGLARLFEETTPARILLIGVAGGLSPDLAVGDVVGALSVQTPGGERLDPSRPPDAAVAGRVLSIPVILGSAEEKRALWNELGRPARTVIDLESSTFVHHASAVGLSWAVVRAISDPQCEDLPLDFSRLSDGDGHVDRTRVIWSLLRHPAALGALIELRRRVKYCAIRLSDAAAAWVALSEEGPDRCS